MSGPAQIDMRAQAASHIAQAEATSLPRVREQHLAAADRWTRLADRQDRFDRDFARAR